jgi:hypothetical protein
LIGIAARVTLGQVGGEAGELTMRDTNLLQLALGIASPWSVTRSDFDPVAHRLDIHIDFKPGSRFICPACGSGDCPVHDTGQAEWRHLDFFQHQAYLHARVPRVRCTRCGVRKIAVPWARPGSGFTLLFEALLMALVTAMPVNAAARLVDEHDTRLWRVIHHYVERARETMDASDVTRVAFDETAARRGHDYITLCVDIDQARVLHVTEGKDAGTNRRLRRGPGRTRWRSRGHRGGLHRHEPSLHQGGEREFAPGRRHLRQVPCGQDCQRCGRRGAPG